MTIEGAVIREQGVTFTVVIVKEHVMNDSVEAGRAIQAFQPSFPGLPVVLMAQDDRGVPTDYGRPDLSRFMESDESLLARWIENPYWQYFCGFSTMQHELPLHPTSLVKWRQRVGAERLSELLKGTIDLAVREKHVAPGELRQVNVDTTVQEKNITHPTDSKLLHRAIGKLVQAAKNRGLRLRQTYVRVAKRAAIKVGRYAHATQFKRMRRELRQLRTWLGRVLRDIRRQQPKPDSALETLLILCEHLHQQQPTDSGKLYSLHEPEVVCIGKGKAH